MPQDLCKALAWEQQAANARAVPEFMKSKRPVQPALADARQAYLRVYWSIAEALDVH